MPLSDWCDCLSSCGHAFRLVDVISLQNEVIGISKIATRNYIKISFKKEEFL